MRTATPPFPLSSNQDQRLSQRIRLRMKAQLRGRGFPRFEIDLVDLSISGFCAECAFSMYPGETVWITLPGLSSLEAQVAWQKQHLYGCRFTQPLYPAVFERLVTLGGPRD